MQPRAELPVPPDNVETPRVQHLLSILKVQFLHLHTHPNNVNHALHAGHPISSQAEDSRQGVQSPPGPRRKTQQEVCRHRRRTDLPLQAAHHRERVVERLCLCAEVVNCVMLQGWCRGTFL